MLRVFPSDSTDATSKIPETYPNNLYISTSTGIFKQARSCKPSNLSKMQNLSENILALVGSQKNIPTSGWGILILFVLGFLNCNILLEGGGTEAPPQRNCETMAGYLEYLDNNPTYAHIRDTMEVFTENYIRNMKAEEETDLKSGLTTIPVVVHVIYKTQSQNISDKQIKSQIDVLNKDYHKLNSDAGKVPNEFKSLAADAKIQFQLAVRDPNCKATTGITRTKTSKDVFVYDGNNRTNKTGTPIKFSSEGGEDAWPSSKYLNIWVGSIKKKSGSGDLLGYSTFPGDPANVDGVVIHYKYFGNTGTVTSPFDKGRTVTHEVGHWMNLFHTFQDGCKGTTASNCSTAGDLVCDTPPVKSPNYQCPGTVNSCTESPDKNDLTMNFMDYTDDACMYMFTNGQTDRIHATLYGPRKDLLASDALIPPSASAADLFAQDTPEDVGNEPNSESTHMYKSPDIWIRNKKDGLTNHEHQNPIASQKNYLYVRIRNRGCQDAGSANVKVYWAKASSGLSWPKPWDGSVTNPALMGGPAGTKSTGTVKGRAYKVLEFEWTPPDPGNYASFGADRAHFCLLARIETSSTTPFGMSTAETGTLWDNVKNNNNIVWKNITIAKNAPSGGKEAAVTAGNFSDDRTVNKLKFYIPRKEGEPDIFLWGMIHLNLGDELFERWQESGGRSRGIEILDPPMVQIYENDAFIEGITLFPGEFPTLNFNFLFFAQGKAPGRNVYQLEMEQYEMTRRREVLIGGVTLMIKEENL
jgi:pregnancy-associated plasma protein-A